MNIPAIEIGSHLIAPRVGFAHHGIYIGDGLVVHYSGLSDGLVSGPIEIATLDVFLGGRELCVRRYERQKYTGQAVAKRARSRIGENKYDLQTNNCEHFCTWAINGRPRSKQVEVVEDFVDVVFPGFGVTSVVRARRNLKQDFSTADIAKDVAELGVKGLVAATTPVALPAYVAYKAIKWIFKP